MTHNADSSASAVLTAFLGQFYDDKDPPAEILLSDETEEQDLLGEALSVRAGHRVKIAVHSAARGASSPPWRCIMPRRRWRAILRTPARSAVFCEVGEVRA